jgi:hypothetical protein
MSGPHQIKIEWSAASCTACDVVKKRSDEVPSANHPAAIRSIRVGIQRSERFERRLHEKNLHRLNGGIPSASASAIACRHALRAALDNRRAAKI